jgi:hypothetical protein
MGFQEYNLLIFAGNAPLSGLFGKKEHFSGVTVTVGKLPCAQEPLWLGPDFILCITHKLTAANSANGSFALVLQRGRFETTWNIPVEAPPNQIMDVQQLSNEPCKTSCSGWGSAHLLTKPVWPPLSAMHPWVQGCGFHVFRMR